MTDVMPEGSFAAPHGLSPAQQDVLDRLGAPVHERPRFDPMLRHEVRELLEHGLAPLREHIAEGERLFISPKTVENHVRNILSKLHLSKRQELIRYALEHGIE